MFALVWAALAAYAHADVELRLLGFGLTKATLLESSVDPTRAAALPDAVTRPSRPAQPVGPTAASASATVPQAAAPDRTVEYGPQRILICGDSMVEKLMLRLADYCRHNGHRLLPAIWYASTATDWARDSKLTQLLGEFEPTFVIVVLGSSELTRRRIDLVEPAVRRIMGRLGSRKYIWVGPPNWREDTGINALLARSLGPGRFFRSADLHFDRASDGIHPTRESSADWMDAIASWITRSSDVPIELARPTVSAPRPGARVFPPPR